MTSSYSYLSVDSLEKPFDELHISHGRECLETYPVCFNVGLRVVEFVLAIEDKHCVVSPIYRQSVGISLAVLSNDRE